MFVEMDKFKNVIEKVKDVSLAFLNVVNENREIRKTTPRVDQMLSAAKSEVAEVITRVSLFYLKWLL